MNGSQIVNMVLRMVMNRLIRKGVNAGFDRMFGSGKAPENMTPEERRRAQSAKKQTAQARKTLRAARRLNRF